MKNRKLTQATRLAPKVLVVSTLLVGAMVHAGTGLATADQQSVEALALRIVSRPEVKEQIERSARALASLPLAADPEAQRALRPAVEELAFATALDAANSDTDRPKVVWAFTAPRTWLGHAVPGSRWGIDNPDNVYRLIPVDGASKYVISVHSHAPVPIQYSFLVYDSFVGEDGRQAHLDTPVAGLRDRDIKVGADGSFTITVDGTPANGRDNHIQTNDSARVLLVRNTFNDWQRQVPLDVSVKRLGSPTHDPLTDQALAVRAAGLLNAATETILGWEKAGFAANKAVNIISKPAARGGGWGFAANGNFKIGDDEALVVTLDPLGAKYVGFDLTNPWLVSLEHIHGTGSLNNEQAQRSRDGSITYVIAAKDPGVYNWLNTSGFHSGNILIRWQVLPESTTTADGAIQSVQVLKLSALSAALPADTQRITAAERRRLIDQRATAYAHRYAAGAAVANLAASR
jgi:Protein of unknown function (DUF1214)